MHCCIMVWTIIHQIFGVGGGDSSPSVFEFMGRKSSFRRGVPLSPSVFYDFMMDVSNVLGRFRGRGGDIPATKVGISDAAFHAVVDFFRSSSSVPVVIIVPPRISYFLSQPEGPVDCPHGNPGVGGRVRTAAGHPSEQREELEGFREEVESHL